MCVGRGDAGVRDLLGGAAVPVLPLLVPESSGDEEKWGRLCGGESARGGRGRAGLVCMRVLDESSAFRQGFWVG